MPKQEGLDKSSGDYALNHSIALPLMGGNNRFGLSMQGCGIKLPKALFLRGANRMELFSGELSTAISTRGITKRGLCACIVVRRRNKLSGGPHSCHQPEPLFFPSLNSEEVGQVGIKSTQISSTVQTVQPSRMNF